MAREKDRLNVVLDKGQVAKLHELAAGLGFVAVTGSQTGQGNIAGLMNAIAEGQYVVLPSVEETARQRDTVYGFMAKVAITTAAVHDLSLELHNLESVSTR